MTPQLTARAEIDSITHHHHQSDNHHHHHHRPPPPTTTTTTTTTTYSSSKKLDHSKKTQPGKKSTVYFCFYMMYRLMMRPLAVVEPDGPPLAPRAPCLGQKCQLGGKSWPSQPSQAGGTSILVSCNVLGNVFLSDSDDLRHNVNVFRIT